MSDGFKRIGKFALKSTVISSIFTVIFLAPFGADVYNFLKDLFFNPSLRVPVINLEDEDYLQWTTISDAENYEVHITNSLSETQKFGVSNNRYSYNLLPVGSFTLQIKAIHTEDSNKVLSESIIYPLFKLPSLDVSFDYETQRIIFNPLSKPGESIQYEIANDINSAPYALTEDNFFNTTSFSPGVYTRSIRAKSNNLNTIRSNYEVITFVNGINPIILNNTLNWSSLSSSGPGITFDIINGSNLNQVFISGLTTNFIDLFDTRIPFGTNSLVVKVNKPGVTIQYPNSRMIPLTKTSDVTITYFPNNNSISWSESLGASGYRIELDNTVLANNQLASMPRTLILPSFASPKLYQVKVTPISSNPNPIFRSNQVFIVGGIIPIYNSETSTLSWDALSDMTWQLLSGNDNSVIAEPPSSFKDLSALTLTQGDHLFKVKYRSTLTIQDQIIYPFSMSISLQKLSSVNFSGYDKVNLSWTSTEVGVQYRVIISELEVNQITNNSFFPIPYTEGSKTIQVISIKSGNFIPSNPAIYPINLSKLATPTGRITTQLDGRFRITVDLVNNATNYVGTIYYYDTSLQFTNNSPVLTEPLNLNNQTNFTSKFPPNYVMIVELKAINTTSFEYMDSDMLRLERFV
jgi:hypothetical protein